MRGTYLSKEKSFIKNWEVLSNTCTDPDKLITANTSGVPVNVEQLAFRGKSPHLQGPEFQGVNTPTIVDFKLPRSLKTKLDRDICCQFSRSDVSRLLPTDGNRQYLLVTYCVLGLSYVAHSRGVFESL